MPEEVVQGAIAGVNRAPHRRCRARNSHISARDSFASFVSIRLKRCAPGAHRFNRIDTKLAKESRKEMWDFLARYLK